MLMGFSLTYDEYMNIIWWKIFNFSEENATHTFSNPNLPEGALAALGFG
jgi:hypothetical protein